ncbi:MAG: hypothetical protein LBB45_02630 [Methanobrevibacter sp.]|nr:hypothetical protein [Candidatus Methanovirga basalitermitum]
MIVHENVCTNYKGGGKTHQNTRKVTFKERKRKKDQKNSEEGKNKDGLSKCCKTSAYQKISIQNTIYKVIFSERNVLFKLN